LLKRDDDCCARFVASATIRNDAPVLLGEGESAMKALYVIASCGLAGGILGFVPRLHDGMSSSIIAGFVGALLGASIGAIVTGRYVGSRVFHLHREVPISAGSIRDHATSWFGRAPWVLAKNDADELVYWRQSQPNMTTAVLLLLIGILPGILYLVWPRPEQTIALGFQPNSAGTNLEIYVGPQAGGGIRTAVDFFNSLHELGIANAT
jgi:hypothetical protein